MAVTALSNRRLTVNGNNIQLETGFTNTATTAATQVCLAWNDVDALLHAGHTYTRMKMIRFVLSSSSIGLSVGAGSGWYLFFFPTVGSIGLPVGAGVFPSQAIQCDLSEWMQGGQKRIHSAGASENLMIQYLGSGSANEHCTVIAELEAI